MIIAISEYNDERLADLSFSERDGKDMHNLLISLSYEIEPNHVMIGYIKYENIRESIKEFFTSKSVKPNDTLLFYFSGHGVLEDTGDHYLSSSEIDPEEPYDKGYSFDDITRMMYRSISTKIILILDCCYSGSASVSKGNSEDEASLGRDAIKNKIKTGEGKCILASSLSYQKSYGTVEKGHSLFTYYLLEGLKKNEESVNKDGNVTPDSLGKYIYDKVTRVLPKQRPIRKVEAQGDIIIASYPELAKEPSNPKTQISILIEKGNNHFSKGEYDEAVKLYDTAIEIDENNIAAWSQLGRSLFELEDYDESEKCWDTVLAIDPYNVTAYRNKAAINKERITMWKFIPLSFLVIFVMDMLESFLIPFPFSLLIIVFNVIIVPYFLYKLMTRKSRKFIEIANQLELKGRSI